MDKIEFHFVHGFLGSPLDWSPVIKLLNHPQYVSYDLNQDIKSISPTSDDFFRDWSELKNKDLHSQRKKVLVAYSLGGRLSLHLNLDHFEKVILIGTHPGLEKDKDIRKKADLDWAQKLNDIPFKDWIRLWDSQPIFKFDLKRPLREVSPHTIPLLQRQLIRWSLAEQSLKEDIFKKYSEKIHWCCGHRDEKFFSLLPKIQTLLGDNSHCFTIPDSGHGVLFEQPQILAQQIQRIINQ